MSFRGSATVTPKKDPQNLFLEFRQDETLRPFLDDDFQVDRFTNDALNTKTVQQNLHKLHLSVSTIDLEIRSQISTHYEDFFEQLEVIQELDSMSTIVGESVDDLDYSVKKIKNELDRGFTELRDKSKQLKRVFDTCDLVRKVQRFLVVADKLKKHLSAGNRELPKAAQALFELECLRKETDMSGIEVIDVECNWIVQAMDEIQAKAGLLLSQGMESQNQSDVANALQVFYNLKTLHEKVQSVIQMISEKVSSTIKLLLDFSALEGSAPPVDPRKQSAGKPVKTPQVAPNPVVWKTALWTRLEKLVDHLQQSCSQIWHLQRVLSKMRDPSSRSSLSEELAAKMDNMPISRIFWSNMTKSLATHFHQSIQTSPFLESTLTSEYPRLLSIFNEFMKRLQTHYEIKQGSEGSLDEERIMLLQTLSKFEMGYLRGVQTRFSSSVDAVFSSPRVLPQQDDINEYVKVLQSELTTSQVTFELSVSIAQCIGRSLRQFCQKSDTMVTSDPEAYQIKETPNGAQARNAHMFNVLHQLFTALTLIVQREEENLAVKATLMFSGLQQQHSSVRLTDVLSNDINEIQRICTARILDPLFSRATDLLERAILLMHQEDFHSAPKKGSMEHEALTSSKYMQIVQKQLHNFHTSVLALYTFCPLVSVRVKNLVTRLLQFFLRHASLLSSISDNGRLRLIADLTQLEMSIVPLRQPKTLGAPYEALRAFRRLIFLETEEVANNAEILAIQPIDLFHHLIGRSASNELQFPHVIKGWSISNYSQWMDSHTLLDNWKMIQQSLIAHSEKINSRGESHYGPIYTTIVALGSKLIPDA